MSHARAADAVEEESKALRTQIATVLSYLDQVMPMESPARQTINKSKGKRQVTVGSGASCGQTLEFADSKDEERCIKALEEENQALRNQVATILSYLDQIMPMASPAR